ncbi:MAG: phospholipid/cholesterol/gamma-HCH transport system substrate-binding protein [Pseudomonadota bacterium]|nr:phospholipid/cholesterol/gamma-HCH transport system substrate-binding protein [Pseudomonadota bacterium]
MNNDTNKKPHYIHRTSYSFQEKLVGTFVLGAAILLLLLLVSLLRQQNMFEDHFEVYGVLKTAEGLAKETAIKVSGVEVGYVSGFEITPNNDIKVSLRIFERYHSLLRADSEIVTGGMGATLFGKSNIEITAGSPDKPLIEKGAFLKVQQSNSVEDVVTEAKLALDKINTIIDDVYVIIDNVHPESISNTLLSLQQASKNIEQLTTQINSAQGPLNTIIHDEKLKKNLQTAGANLQDATQSLGSLAGKVDYDVNQVPLIMQKIQAALDETSVTIQAAQRIWPISSAIEKNPQHAPLIQPLSSE